MSTLNYPIWLKDQSDNQQIATSKRDRTRAKLKIAASELLNHTLYQDLHISLICEKADVGTGTFYRYFKGKKELTEEILEDVVQRFTDLMPDSRQEGKHHSMFELFAQSNLQFFKFADANHGLYRCLLQVNAQEFYLGEIFENSLSSWAIRVTKSILRGHIEKCEDASMKIDLKESRTLIKVHCLASMLNDITARLTFRNEKSLKKLFKENDFDEQRAAKFLAVLWYRVIFGNDPKGYTAESPFDNTQQK